MRITAHLDSARDQNLVRLQTNEQAHSIVIPPKPSGFGSSANGGELLFLALAACYCNDIYREAARRGIQVQRVEVEVTGDFDAEGGPAKNLSYRATVAAAAAKEQIEELMRHTDRVAEIQNTLRGGTPVELVEISAIPI